MSDRTSEELRALAYMYDVPEDVADEEAAALAEDVDPVTPTEWRAISTALRAGADALDEIERLRKENANIAEAKVVR